MPPERLSTPGNSVMPHVPLAPAPQRLILQPGSPPPTWGPLSRSAMPALLDARPLIVFTFLTALVAWLGAS
jgi:hypothetical protein